MYKEFNYGLNWVEDLRHKDKECCRGEDGEECSPDDICTCFEVNSVEFDDYVIYIITGGIWYRMRHEIRYDKETQKLLYVKCDTWSIAGLNERPIRKEVNQEMEYREIVDKIWRMRR